MAIKIVEAKSEDSTVTIPKSTNDTIPDSISLIATIDTPVIIQSDASTSLIVDLDTNHSEIQYTNFFGDLSYSAIGQASEVQAYYLDMGQPDTSYKAFYGFKVLEKIDSLSILQIKKLQLILGNRENYLNEAGHKRCGFQPNLGFKFITSTDTVAVLFAFDCDIIKVIGLDDETTKDFDLNHRKFVDFGNQIFQNAFDIFLQE